MLPKKKQIFVYPFLVSSSRESLLVIANVDFLAKHLGKNSVGSLLLGHLHSES